MLRAHQITTKAITQAGLVPWTLVAAHVVPRLPLALAASLENAQLIPHLATARKVFTLASIGMLVVWTNIRLVKAAWAIGAL